MSAGFHVEDGHLRVEDRSVAELAEKHGTPLYVYSQNHFLRQYRSIERALEPVDHLICYAVKSNGNLGILSRMAQAGSGFDIVSGGELRRVLEAGGSPENIVYAGVGKTEAEIEMALNENIHTFNVESRPELERLDRIAGRLGTEARVAFRVNPDVDAKTHEKITTGKKENKFGIPIATVEEHVAEASRAENLRWMGLHFHIGSQITTLDPYREVTEKASRLIRRLRDRGYDASTLNLGGGLGIRYRDEQPLDPGDWADVILPSVRELDVKLIVEPGRFIVGNAGVLVTRVEYVKKSVTKNFVVVDGGMNDLIRPAMYDAYHEIVPVRASDRPEITADVVGPVCETGDYFGKDRRFPQPEPGDYMAVKSAGAYGMAMASQYNAFPRPAEVLVDGDETHIVRERESYEDLWRGEAVLAPSTVT